MRTFSIPAAKRKLSEIVDRAAEGESIGLTKGDRLVAVIGPPKLEVADLHEVFKAFEKTRKRSKKIPGVTIRSLIEEGRT